MREVFPNNKSKRVMAQRLNIEFTYSFFYHQKADWVSIHEKICQLLIPIRTSFPFFNSEKERKHGMEQLLHRQLFFSPAGNMCMVTPIVSCSLCVCIYLPTVFSTPCIR
uniref:Uncharacterized protein n=1 Tax=Gopherus agassizii TaxID=38772 RepID=A0A452GWR9_9SAUR